MIRHSQRLRQKIDLMMPRMREAAGMVWNHPNFPEVFPEFMFTIHGIIRATHPSMKAAAACAQALAANDPVAAAMARYLYEHADEEKGHDEWALADLEVLGIPADEVRARVPSTAVANLVGSQYYWMNHFHPVAYLSYIAISEAPPNIDYLDEKVKSSGLPKDAFRTWYFHGQLDHGHVQEFDDMLDSLPLNDWHHSILGMNAFHSAELQARAFELVAEEFDASRALVAAR